MASFTGYHTTIEITAGGVPRTLPVDTLTVRAVPYSRSGEIAVRLFDGRLKQRVDGWFYEVELSWDQLPDAQAAQDLYESVVNLIASGGTVDLDPLGSSKTLSVVVTDASEALQAFFDRRIRKRRASIKLSTTTPVATPASWLGD